MLLARRALADGAPDELRRQVFGHAAVPSLVRLFVARERNVQLKAAALDGVPAIQITWSTRR